MSTDVVLKNTHTFSLSLSLSLSLTHTHTHTHTHTRVHTHTHIQNTHNVESYKRVAQAHYIVDVVLDSGTTVSAYEHH